MIKYSIWMIKDKNGYSTNELYHKFWRADNLNFAYSAVESINKFSEERGYKYELEVREDQIKSEK